MPEFIKDQRRFYNPVEYALSRIGGTYKMPILWRLKDGEKRYSQLKKSIGHISDRMLSKNLKELEAHGFVYKQTFAAVPPRVEYRLSQKGEQAIGIIEILRNYGFELMKTDGIPFE